MEFDAVALFWLGNIGLLRFGDAGRCGQRDVELLGLVGVEPVEDLENGVQVQCRDQFVGFSVVEHADVLKAMVGSVEGERELVEDVGQPAIGCGERSLVGQPAQHARVSFRDLFEEQGADGVGWENEPDHEP